MHDGGVRLWLEPWSAEYEGSVQLSDELTPATVDVTVEMPVWEAVTPRLAEPVGSLAFVDGVRRIEHRLLVTAGDRTVFGLLGSLAVGATIVGVSPTVCAGDRQPAAGPQRGRSTGNSDERRGLDDASSLEHGPSLRQTERALEGAAATGDAEGALLVFDRATGGAAADREARGAAVAHVTVRRVLITGAGLVLPPLLVTVGRTPVEFEPLTEAENLPETPQLGLQKAMREAEATLTRSLLGEGGVVIQDGPLSFLEGAPGGRVLGFVKRLQRSYLEGSEMRLLPNLAPGERTPLFLISGRQARYSWYMRLARGRVIESPLAGVVRLETPVWTGLAGARALADLSARALPPFASDAARDPRAPQNLIPVGGLEARLKHLLGDPALLRRAIETRLMSEVNP